MKKEKKKGKENKKEENAVNPAGGKIKSVRFETEGRVTSLGDILAILLIKGFGKAKQKVEVRIQGRKIKKMLSLNPEFARALGAYAGWSDYYQKGEIDEKEIEEHVPDAWVEGYREGYSKTEELDKEREGKVEFKEVADSLGIEREEEMGME